MKLTATVMSAAKFPGPRATVKRLDIKGPSIQNVDKPCPRLGVLGEAVMKLAVIVQLLGRYPGWNEGEVSVRKDEVVSSCFAIEESALQTFLSAGPRGPIESHFRECSSATKKRDGGPFEGRSTTKTMLARSSAKTIMGLIYARGGFEHGSQFVGTLGLQLEWAPVQKRISDIRSAKRLGDTPPALALAKSVERAIESAIDYDYKCKTLLADAVNVWSIPFQRLELLGDAVLDLIVVDELYRLPRRFEGPDIVVRRSAIVNGQMLTYLALEVVSKTFPTLLMTEGRKTRKAHRRLRNSVLQRVNPGCVPALVSAFDRFQGEREEIRRVLSDGETIPWGQLEKIRGPKMLSDVVESVIGAIFVDSDGDLIAVRRALYAVGIIEVLRLVSKDGVDLFSRDGASRRVVNGGERRA